MKKNFLALGTCAFALALGLVACGDDGSTNGPSNGHNDSSASFVESEGDLPNCTESGDGSVSFVDGTKEGFVCKDRKWLHYDMIVDVDENLPGCTGSREGLTAYLYEENRELKCVEGAWGAVGEEAGSSSSVFPSSSSSVIPGTAPESGSSVADKANWAYLNPNIDYGTMTDTRDGQVYKTVKICDKDNNNCQTWMAENLNYAYKGVKFDNGYYTSDSTSWCGGGSGTIAGDCSIYGRLYTWTAAVDSVAIYEKYGEECGDGKYCTRFSASALATAPVRGVCPSGWHLPSNAEWSALYTNVGGTDYAGQKLKANSSLWSTNTGTDEYGFSVLPAGLRYNYDNYGVFTLRGNNADFWSSTEYERSSINAWDQYFYYNNDDVHQSYNGRSHKENGFSVRCLKD